MEAKVDMWKGKKVGATGRKRKVAYKVVACPLIQHNFGNEGVVSLLGACTMQLRIGRTSNGYAGTRWSGITKRVFLVLPARYPSVVPSDDASKTYSRVKSARRYGESYL